jgi:hypothetical protein
VQIIIAKITCIKFAKAPNILKLSCSSRFTFLQSIFNWGVFTTVGGTPKLFTRARFVCTAVISFYESRESKFWSLCINWFCHLISSVINCISVCLQFRINARDRRIIRDLLISSLIHSFCDLRYLRHSQSCQKIKGVGNLSWNPQDNYETPRGLHFHLLFWLRLLCLCYYTDWGWRVVGAENSNLKHMEKCIENHFCLPGVRYSSS